MAKATSVSGPQPSSLACAALTLRSQTSRRHGVSFLVWEQSKFLNSPQHGAQTGRAAVVLVDVWDIF